MSQATQQHRQLLLGTSLGDDKLLLTAIAGREEISRLFSYQLEMLSEDASLQAVNIVGKNVTFIIRRQDGSPRYFNGFVKQFSAGPMSRMSRFRRYRAEIVPWLWFLTQTADCRIFQNKTVPDIIEQIFRDLGFSDFDRSGLRAAYQKRVYCVQYRETDFNFVSRLMEEEGVYYSFRHENGKHTLMMADAPTGYRPGADPVLKYQHSSTHHAAEERITQWEHCYQYRPGKWAYTDYNFETPHTSLMSKEQTVVSLSQNKNFEVYDYPGEYEVLPEGRRLVKLRMEEEEAAHDVVQGASVCRMLTPGEKFKLAEFDAADENGREYVTTAVEHDAFEPASYETTQADGDGQEGPHYRNRFCCIPAAVPFRAARTTRKPLVEGPQTAVIVGPPGEEIYPDQYGRVKVQFHWDREGKRDENSSCWIRVSQMHAGKGWGYMDLPRIGEEVIVDFLEGDPDRPIITGRVYNADNMPPYALPAGKTRRGNTTKTYKGAGFNEMSMDDTPGAEQIRIHGQYNMDSVIENNLTEHVKVDRTRNVDNNETMTIGNNQALTVAVNKTVQVGSNHSETVGVNQSVSVGSNQSNTVGVMKNEMVGVNSNEVVGVAKTTTVGLAYALSVGAMMNTAVGFLQMEEVGMNKKIIVGSKFEIVCGASRIVMESGGKVTIEGTEFLFNASGPVNVNAGGPMALTGDPIDLN